MAATAATPRTDTDLARRFMVLLSVRPGVRRAPPDRRARHEPAELRNAVATPAGQMTPTWDVPRADLREHHAMGYPAPTAHLPRLNA
ncbi:hypothetical protein GCM10023347_50300 [Streptomyces chumphonensis]